MKITKENIEFYYINLNNRDDKKAHTENHLEKHNIQAKRFNALTGDSDYNNIITTKFTLGHRGCFLSHMKLISEYTSDKILGIFEDDVVLCDDFDTRLKYIENNFEKDWDIFFFSSFYHLNNDEKKWKDIEFEFTDIKYINRVYSSFCTHAYLVNPKSISKIYNLCMKNVNEAYAIDHLYLLIEPELNCYAFTPGMATQLPGLNDIDQVFKDQSLFKNVVGDHYFINSLKEFDYDSFYYKNSTNYFIYDFYNKNFYYKLAINKYFNYIYKQSPDNPILELYDYTVTIDLLEKCNKNKIVIDIGANHGLFAVPCALYGYTVYGFEPVKSNIETLNASISLNKLENLTIVPVALFNDNIESTIFIPSCSDNSSLNKDVAIANMHTKEYQSETVQCIKFDDWIVDKPFKNDISFIKIDVQGFEHPVIDGMREFFKIANDIYVFLEWDEKLTNEAGYSLDELYEIFSSNGFIELPSPNRLDKLFYKK